MPDCGDTSLGDAMRSTRSAALCASALCLLGLSRCDLDPAQDEVMQTDPAALRALESSHRELLSFFRSNEIARSSFVWADLAAMERHIEDHEKTLSMQWAVDSDTIEQWFPDPEPEIMLTLRFEVTEWLVTTESGTVRVGITLDDGEDYAEAISLQGDLEVLGLDDASRAEGVEGVVRQTVKHVFARQDALHADWEVARARAQDKLMGCPSGTMYQRERRSAAPDVHLCASGTGVRTGPYAEGELDDDLSGVRLVEGELYRGKRTGEWTFRDGEGTRTSRVTYRGGVPDGPVTIYWSNGKKQWSGELDRNRRHGDWKYYSASGARVGAFRFSNGTLRAAWTYHDTGQIHETSSYDENGRRDGTWTRKNKSGVVVERRSYSHGLEDGTWRWYRSDGTTKRSEVWSAGTLTKTDDTQVRASASRSRKRGGPSGSDVARCASEALLGEIAGLPYDDSDALTRVVMAGLNGFAINAIVGFFLGEDPFADTQALEAGVVSGLQQAMCEAGDAACITAAAAATANCLK